MQKNSVGFCICSDHDNSKHSLRDYYTLLEKTEFPNLLFLHAIDLLIKTGCPCEMIGFGEGRRVRLVVVQGLILVGSSQSS